MMESEFGSEPSRGLDEMFAAQQPKVNVAAVGVPVQLDACFLSCTKSRHEKFFQNYSNNCFA